MAKQALQLALGREFVIGPTTELQVRLVKSDYVMNLDDYSKISSEPLAKLQQPENGTLLTKLNMVLLPQMVAGGQTDQLYWKQNHYKSSS